MPAIPPHLSRRGPSRPRPIPSRTRPPRPDTSLLAWSPTTTPITRRSRRAPASTTTVLPPIHTPRDPARGGHHHTAPTGAPRNPPDSGMPPHTRLPHRTDRPPAAQHTHPYRKQCCPPHHPLSTPHLSPPSSRFHHSFSPLSYSGKNNSREPRGDSITRSKPVIGENKPLSVRNNGKER